MPLSQFQWFGSFSVVSVYVTVSVVSCHCQCPINLYHSHTRDSLHHGVCSILKFDIFKHILSLHIHRSPSQTQPLAQPEPRDEETAYLETEQKLEKIRRSHQEKESQELEQLRQKQVEAEAELEELKKRREQRRLVREEEERRKEQEEQQRLAKEEVIMSFGLDIMWISIEK